MTYDRASRSTGGTKDRYDNVTARAFDNAGRIASEQIEFTVPNKTYALSHEYDAANRRTKITMPETGPAHTT